MDISLNSIADIVINNVYAGLKAPSNYSLSRDQVIDEISLLRNRIANDLALKGGLNTQGLYQTIECLEFTCKDISECCTYESGIQVLHAKIPRLLALPNINPVRYVGAIAKGLGGVRQFKVVTGNSYIYSKYDIVTSAAPTAWFDDNSNLWIINPPTKAMKVGALTALFENPKELDQYACCTIDNDSPYPVPGYMVDMITGKLINDYLRYYRTTNPTPNTIADIATGGPKK